MNEQFRSYQISLGIHAALALAVLGLGSGLAIRPRPAALDLSLLNSQSAPEREKLLHPRAKLDPARPVPAPPANEPAAPQVERANVTADLAPVAAPAAPAAEPQEAPGISRDAVRERYVKQNFSGIRDKIHRNLAYPAMARKMGWSGQVKVLFMVCTDGSVKNISVLSSCGYEALDRSAVESIKRAAPYPAPQADMELVMPITYELE